MIRLLVTYYAYLTLISSVGIVLLAVWDRRRWPAKPGQATTPPAPLLLVPEPAIVAEVEPEPVSSHVATAREEVVAPTHRPMVVDHPVEISYQLAPAV